MDLVYNLTHLHTFSFVGLLMEGFILLCKIIFQKKVKTVLLFTYRNECVLIIIFSLSIESTGIQQLPNYIQSINTNSTVILVSQLHLFIRIFWHCKL